MMLTVECALLEERERERERERTCENRGAVGGEEVGSGEGLCPWV